MANYHLPPMVCTGDVDYGVCIICDKINLVYSDSGLKSVKGIQLLVTTECYKLVLAIK